MSFAPVSPVVAEGLNKFLSIVYHQWLNYAIYTFAELRLADRLINAQPNQGFTVEEILGDDRKDWDSQFVSRIVRACVYGGIVKLVNDDKHFILTETGKMMTSDNPSHARDYIIICLGPVIVSSCQKLPDRARQPGKGSGTFHSSGREFYELMQLPEHREFLTAFGGTMTTSSVLTSSTLVANVDFSRFKTIVDIGGNRGTLLANILKHFPTVEQGMVLDLPQVVKQYENYDDFQTYGIPKERWSFVGGSAFDASTIPQADAYITKYFIHTVSDEECVKIFSAIRKANENKKTPTTLLIIEHVILPNETIGSWQTFAVDILMGALTTDGRERSVEEFRQLLKQGGFELTKVYPIEAPQSVVEAVLINNNSS